MGLRVEFTGSGVPGPRFEDSRVQGLGFIIEG
jgi:hypothetical protein